MNGKNEEIRTVADPPIVSNYPRGNAGLPMKAKLLLVLEAWSCGLSQVIWSLLLSILLNQVHTRLENRSILWFGTIIILLVSTWFNWSGLKKLETAFGWKPIKTVLLAAILGPATCFGGVLFSLYSFWLLRKNGIKVGNGFDGAAIQSQIEALPNSNTNRKNALY